MKVWTTVLWAGISSFAMAEDIGIIGKDGRDIQFIKDGEAVVINKCNKFEIIKPGVACPGEEIRRYESREHFLQQLTYQLINSKKVLSPSISKLVAKVKLISNANTDFNFKQERLEALEEISEKQTKIKDYYQAHADEGLELSEDAEYQKLQADREAIISDFLNADIAYEQMEEAKNGVELAFVALQQKLSALYDQVIDSKLTKVKGDSLMLLSLLIENESKDLANKDIFLDNPKADASLERVLNLANQKCEVYSITTNRYAHSLKSHNFIVRGIKPSRDQMRWPYTYAPLQVTVKESSRSGRSLDSIDSAQDGELKLKDFIQNGSICHEGEPLISNHITGAFPLTTFSKENFTIEGLEADQEQDIKNSRGTVKAVNLLPKKALPSQVESIRK